MVFLREANPDAGKYELLQWGESLLHVENIDLKANLRQFLHAFQEPSQSSDASKKEIDNW